MGQRRNSKHAIVLFFTSQLQNLLDCLYSQADSQDTDTDVSCEDTPTDTSFVGKYLWIKIPHHELSMSVLCYENSFPTADNGYIHKHL